MISHSASPQRNVSLVGATDSNRPFPHRGLWYPTGSWRRSRQGCDSAAPRQAMTVSTILPSSSRLGRPSGGGAHVYFASRPARRDECLARSDRLDLIRQIEAARGSRLVVAVWGDRQGLPTVIAADTHPVFFEHLEQIGRVEKLDVLLYTSGGHTLAAWGIANLLREYCSALGVLVPHRALSAGTLLTLAADDIIMSRLGQLSPIDPSITSPLGPTIQVPNQPNQQQVVPVSVEDAVGFIDLAIKGAGLKEERSLMAVFDRLSSQVHPLALGAVFRSREQIVALADRLLSFHMAGDDRKEDRDRIVTRLTRELGSHDYLIGRTEARTFLRLNVLDGDPAVESLMLELFRHYEKLLELRVPYNPDGFLGANASGNGVFNRAVIESAGLTSVFRTIRDISRIQVMLPGMPGPSTGIQERTTSESWVSDLTI